MGFYGAAQVARIRRHLQNIKSGKASDETVLAIITGLTALPDLKINAETLLEIIRGHWAIEDGNHYVRDRTYDEDRCQVREPNSAQILATLRSLARFLAKQRAHRPATVAKTTTPSLIRFCDAHRNKAIHWLMSPRGFK